MSEDDDTLSRAELGTMLAPLALRESRHTSLTEYLDTVVAVARLLDIDATRSGERAINLGEGLEPPDQNLFNLIEAIVASRLGRHHFFPESPPLFTVDSDTP